MIIETAYAVWVILSKQCKFHQILVVDPHKFFFFIRSLLLTLTTVAGELKFKKKTFLHLPSFLFHCMSLQLGMPQDKLVFYFCLRLPKFLNEFTIINAQQQTCTCISFLNHGFFINVKLATDELVFVFDCTYFCPESIWKCHRTKLLFYFFLPWQSLHELTVGNVTRQTKTPDLWFVQENSWQVGK